jgi:hypothetical protein
MSALNSGAVKAVNDNSAFTFMEIINERCGLCGEM